jgi:hypothetical protein
VLTPAIEKQRLRAPPSFIVTTDDQPAPGCFFAQALFSIVYQGGFTPGEMGTPGGFFAFGGEGRTTFLTFNPMQAVF